MKKIFFLITAMLLMSSVAKAQSDDYTPLLREGVKWVCTEVFTNDWVRVKDDRLYTYELKGDTVINGKTYKKCYWGTNQPSNKFYFSRWDPNRPLVGLREEDRQVYGVVIQHEFDYETEWSWLPIRNNSTEMLVYDFDTYTNGMYLWDEVEVAGNQCDVMSGYINYFSRTIVESVGNVAYNSDLLMVDDLCTCGYNTEHSLHHLEDADGNVLYKGPSYNHGFWTKGDFKRNGKVDVEDVNFIINYILQQLPKDGYYDDYPEHMKAWCDLNEDGKVDIEDVNMVINTILGIGPAEQ
ncbi:MAG: hypothetical protein J5565_05140 [Muribaculaceae bacterium]|nr:hypothetical protein [Muribaculaceae bacterium]